MTATDVDATADDDYDPFEAFNKSNGAGTVENPYPDFVALRRDTPVAELDLREMFGLADDEAPEHAVWTVNTFDSRPGGAAGRRRVLVEGVRGDHGCGVRPLHPGDGRARAPHLPGPHPAGVHPQGHGALGDRRHRSRRCTPSSTTSSSDGRADLVRELTFPFPFEVIADQLVLPEDDKPRFHRMATELISVQVDMERALRASADLHAYFSDDHRRAPGRPRPGPDQRARPGRAGRSAADRRRDHRLPPPAALGRGGDDLPLVEQPALRPAHPSRAAGRRPRRPLAAAPGHRGGPPLGAAAADDHAHRGSGRRARGQGAPPGRHRGHQHRGRPTTTRPAGTTPRPSTSSDHRCPTSPSPAASTCASASIWPAWRRWSP